jgi:hypothetical protein
MSVRIDLDELTEAFADASPALNYYVDRETGEVILVSDTLGFIEAGLQRIEMSKARARYLPVPVSGVNDLSEDLESFIDDLDDETTGATMEELLDEPDLGKSLATYLAKNEEIASAWADHRHERFEARAKRWLTEQGFTTS